MFKTQVFKFRAPSQEQCAQWSHCGDVAHAYVRDVHTPTQITEKSLKTIFPYLCILSYIFSLICQLTVWNSKHFLLIFEMVIVFRTSYRFFIYSVIYDYKYNYLRRQTFQYQYIFSVTKSPIAFPPRTMSNCQSLISVILNSPLSTFQFPLYFSKISLIPQFPRFPTAPIFKPQFVFSKRSDSFGGAT